MANFTSDFDRQRAGYSPDRVDALVWATTELLVEQMNGYGIFELYRRRAEAKARAEMTGEQPEPEKPEAGGTEKAPKPRGDILGYPCPI